MIVGGNLDRLEFDTLHDGKGINAITIDECGGLHLNEIAAIAEVDHQRLLDRNLGAALAATIAAPSAKRAIYWEEDSLRYGVAEQIRLRGEMIAEAKQIAKGEVFRETLRFTISQWGKSDGGRAYLALVNNVDRFSGNHCSSIELPRGFDVIPGDRSGYCGVIGFVRGYTDTGYLEAMKLSDLLYMPTVQFDVWARDEREVEKYLAVEC